MHKFEKGVFSCWTHNLESSDALGKIRVNGPQMQSLAIGAWAGFQSQLAWAPLHRAQLEEPYAVVLIPVSALWPTRLFLVSHHSAIHCHLLRALSPPWLLSLFHSSCQATLPWNTAVSSLAGRQVEPTDENQFLGEF